MAQRSMRSYARIKTDETCNDVRERASAAVLETRRLAEEVKQANQAVTAAVARLPPSYVTAPSAKRERDRIRPLVDHAQALSKRYFEALAEAVNLRRLTGERCATSKKTKNRGSR